MKRYLLYFASVLAVISLPECKKNEPASTTIPADPVDTSIGLYRGTLHYYYKSTPTISPVIDTTYDTVVSVSKSGRDSLLIGGGVNWIAYNSPFYNFLKYDPDNTYGPFDTCANCGVVTFYPAKDSIHIEINFVDSGGAVQQYSETFSGKKVKQ